MSKHKYINLSDLTVDQNVQRVEGLDERKVTKMAAAFNPLALGSIIVSKRGDGQMIVLDGWHRTSAAVRAGHKDSVSAIVFEELTPEQEHELFVLYNTSTNVSALTKFIQRIQYGDPLAVDVNRIISSHGWKVDARTGDGHFSAVVAAENVYIHGARSVSPGAHPDVLETAFGIITGSWGLDWRGGHGIIVSGIGKFIGRYGSIADVGHVINQLQLMTPYTLRGKAKALTELTGGTQDAAIGRIITDSYNVRKRTNKLPDWQWTH